MQTSGIEDVLDAFLAALGDPEGGTALRAMHSADAPVRYPEGIGRAGEIDRDTFGEYIARSGSCNPHNRATTGLIADRSEIRKIVPERLLQ